MARFEIEDEFQVFVLDGEQVAGPESTRAHPVSGLPRARWTQLTIYRSNEGVYALHKVNLSRVWHDAGGAGHIRTPAEVSAGDLPEDAVYCGDMPWREGRVQCPARDRGAAVRDPFSFSAGRRTPAPARGPVLAEKPEYYVWRCGDPAEVIARLRHAYKRVDHGAESAPVRRLLEEAARNDPAFRFGKPAVRI
jgi:hypothetical protein